MTAQAGAARRGAARARPAARSSARAGPGPVAAVTRPGRANARARLGSPCRIVAAESAGPRAGAPEAACTRNLQPVGSNSFTGNLPELGNSKLLLKVGSAYF